MKVDVTIPASILKSAEHLAQKQGISLSELYTAALTDYVDKYDGELITERLNELYSKESSELDSVLYLLQINSIESESW